MYTNRICSASNIISFLKCLAYPTSEEWANKFFFQTSTNIFYVFQYIHLYLFYIILSCYDFECVCVKMNWLNIPYFPLIGAICLVEVVLYMWLGIEWRRRTTNLYHFDKRWLFFFFFVNEMVLYWWMIYWLKFKSESPIIFIIFAIGLL